MGFRMYVNTNDESIEFPKFYGYAEEKYVKQSWDILNQDCEYNEMHIGGCYGPVKLDSKSFAKFIYNYMKEYLVWGTADRPTVNLCRKINEIIKSGKDVTLDWH